MRNLVITENMTLDGAIHANEGRKAETRGLSPVPLGRRAHALQRERMTLTR